MTKRTRRKSTRPSNIPAGNRAAWPAKHGFNGPRAGDQWFTMRVPRTLLKAFRDACAVRGGTVAGDLRTYMERRVK